mgnify:CR=1 FL=1|tara:strand:+ start:3866 stop:5161 length:1296 start_codon:yes stop_codon:yes gene_type:complete
MKLVHRANACFSLCHNEKHILMDPWLDGPAVAQGWAQYPPAKVKYEDIPKPDLIYISHIHSDHCEKETLSQIDKETPIIIMDLGPNFLYKMLRREGFKNINLLKEKKLTEINTINGMYAEPFGGSFDHIQNNVIDSGIVFKIEDQIIINHNDNNPSPDLCYYLKNKYKKINLALIPGGGGSGYPAMYENLSKKEKQVIIKKQLNVYLKMFSSAVDILKPEIAIPVAGGFAIRGHKDKSVNWLQMRFLNHNDIKDYHNKYGNYKKSKILPMQPEIEIDLVKKEYTNYMYQPWTKEQSEEYFNQLAKEKIKPLVETQYEVPCISRLMSTARKNLWIYQENHGMKPDYKIYFDIYDINKLFELSLSVNEIKELKYKSVKKKPYLRMKIDQNTMLEWLLGFEDFNMLDSGHRISFFRDPNDYVVEAYYLMSLFRL